MTTAVIRGDDEHDAVGTMPADGRSVLRVAANELHAVGREGILVRYALLGPVAFVVVGLPSNGTAGTSLEDPCLLEHHGLVIKGELSVVHDSDGTDRFERGTAFYVPPGPPAHHFAGTPGCVVAGFAAVTEDTDTSLEALTAQGFEIVNRPGPVGRLPQVVQVRGGDSPFRRRGAIEVEGRVMGPWLFMRSNFGPESGFTGGWCEVPHWGLVLDGAIAINFRTSTELAGAGDAFYVEPGHRFETPDGASVIDYTPLAELDGSRRVATWRRAAARKVGILDPQRPRTDVGKRGSRARSGPAPALAEARWDVPKRPPIGTRRWVGRSALRGIAVDPWGGSESARP